MARSVFLLAPLTISLLFHGGVELRVASVTSGVAVVLWAWWCWREGWARSRPGPVGLAGLAFLAVALVSAAFSVHPHASLLAIQRYLGFAAAVWSWRIAVRRPEHMRHAAHLLVAIGALAALCALLFEPSLIGAAAPDRAQRLTFLFVNPNHFAAFLNLIVWIAAGLAVSHRSGYRLLFAQIAIVAQVEVALTGSRAGLISSFAGLTVFAALTLVTRDRQSEHTNRRAGWAAAVVLLSAVAVGVLVVTLKPSAPRVGSALEERLTTDRLQRAREARTDIWRRSAGLVRTRPMLGSGPGTYGDAFAPLQAAGRATQKVTRAHNDYLETAVECGLIALAALLTCVALLILSALRGLHEQRDRTSRAIGIGALAGCFASLVHALAEFHLQIPAILYTFLGLAAVALAASEVGRRASVPRTRSPRQAAALGSVALMALAVLAMTIGGEHYRSRATTLIAAGDLEAARDAVRVGRRLDPLDAELVAISARVERLWVRDHATGPVAGRAFQPSLARYDQAIARNPMHGRYYLERGEVLAEMERWDDAEESLERAVELMPSAAAAPYALGRHYYRRDLPQRAQPHWQRALELQPRLLSTVLENVWARGLGHSAAAIFVPEEPRLRRWFANELFARDLDDGAVAELALAYALAPSATAAERHVAVLIREGKIEIARELVARYASEYPEAAGLERQRSRLEAAPSEHDAR